MSSHQEDQHEENNATAAEERTTTLKHNIEKALAQEKQDIQAGRLKDENPLDMIFISCVRLPDEVIYDWLRNKSPRV
jgi:hypothetical protein